MKSKKGAISLLVGILVITVTVMIIWNIVGGSIGKLFNTITDPIVDKLGLGKSEEERERDRTIAEELLSRAKQVLDEVNSMSDRCINVNKYYVSCSCGTIDFTELNDYSLKLTHSDAGNILELLDSSSDTVYGHFNIGNFLIPPKYIKEDSGDFGDYKNNKNNKIFSKDRLVYSILGSSDNKFGGNMHEIHFDKDEMRLITFDDNIGYTDSCDNPDPTWNTILQSYENNKCDVSKFTCKIVSSTPCQCFNAGGLASKSNPETCTSESYCYEGKFGCHTRLVAAGNCKLTNPDFEMPSKCRVDDACLVTGSPCSCDTSSYTEICIDGEYCYDGMFGCHNKPGMASCTD